MPPLEGHVRALFAAAVLVFFAPACSRAQGEDGGPMLTPEERWQLEKHLPPFVVAQQVYAVCCLHHDLVQQARGLWTVRPDIGDARLCNAQLCWWAWWHIQEATRPGMSAEWRRGHLADLIMLIGLDAYLAKRWPACDP